MIALGIWDKAMRSFQVLMIFFLAFSTKTEKIRHISGHGQFDELNAEEYLQASKIIADQLNLKLGPHGLLILKDIRWNPEISWKALLYFNRIIRASVEIPPKAERLTETPFLRKARISVFRPAKNVVEEYVVQLSNNTVVRKRKVRGLKRPIDAVEMNVLIQFLASLCADINVHLRQHYDADFYVNGELCTSSFIFNDSYPMDRPNCLFPMYASPAVTEERPNQRTTIFRLNRMVTPLNQFPTSVQFEVEHTQVRYEHWKLLTIWFNGKNYTSLAQFSKAIKAATKSKDYENYFWEEHIVYPKSVEHTARNFNVPGPIFPGSIDHRHITYNGWGLNLGMLLDSGLRIYNVTFNDELIASEMGLEETVTIYAGGTPFMQKMISVESMFGIGGLTSELSPGVDCPLNALFFSVSVVPDPFYGPVTVKNGICVYESTAEFHDGPLRRHVELFSGDPLTDDPKYATGVKEKSMYVVTTIALYNYQYTLYYIFSPTGQVSGYVVPSGYVHVEIPTPESMNEKFGHVNTAWGLQYTIHTHNFLFFIDLLGSENSVYQIRIENEMSSKANERFSMQLHRIQNEVEGKIDDGFTLFCKNGTKGQGCLRIKNMSPIKSLLKSSTSKSFSWINHSLWFTKYHESEVRGSSVYNGVDLTNPEVDFSLFSADNETLDGNIVLWMNVGFIHIPVNEDIPHTPSRGSQLGFILLPHNLFSKTPDYLSPQRVVTRNMTEWTNGYVMDDATRILTIFP